MRRFLIAVALGAAGLVAAGCDPYYPPPGAGPGPYPEPGGYGPGGPPVGEQVAALGCPIPGVEPNCLSFRSVEGYTFDISSAQARPDPRSPFALEITGRVSPALGYCQQGQPLEDIQVRQTNLRCVEGAVQGYRPPAGY
jgi:hypothetical protein